MKLKYILPFASIASVTAIIIPMTTSCSSGSGINLDKNKDIFGVLCLATKNPISFEKEQSYTFNINLKKYDWDKATFEMDGYGTFDFFDLDKQTTIDLKYSVEEYIVDGSKLTPTSTIIEQMDNNTYSFNESNGLIFKHEGLNKKSVATLKIKVNEANTATPIFLPVRDI